MKRITIITDNRVGILADISKVLASNNININALNSEAIDKHGVITLVTNHCDQALEVLRTAGFKAVTDDVLIIRLKDEPGALAKIAERFKHTGVNIRSIHIIGHHKGYSTVVLAADETEQAQALLADIIIV